MLSKNRRTPRQVMDAARGEVCTLNIPGICNYDADTTVCAHLSYSEGGGARLTGPLSVAFACSDCHDAVDRRTDVDLDSRDRDFYLRRGQTRTINRLIAKGVVMVKGL
jgi:hypothetical protein